MKQPQNPRRGRGRGGPGKRHQPSKNRNFESSGGETKVRGNAQQVLDKYQALARDAASAGEHIQAEGYWQHAEHYYRILNADRDDRPANQGNDASQGDNGGATHTADATNASQPEQANARKIPIRTVAESPVAESPVDEDAGVGNREQAQFDGPIRLTEQPGTVKTADLADQPDNADAEKPKRRGRPRKVAADTADTDDAPESPDTDSSPETVSA